MKLSDALILGSTLLKPKQTSGPGDGTTEGCALQLGLMGRDGTCRFDSESPVDYGRCIRYWGESFSQEIWMRWDLETMILGHSPSIDKFAGWVRSIESEAPTPVPTPVEPSVLATVPA